MALFFAYITVLVGLRGTSNAARKQPATTLAGNVTTTHAQLHSVLHAQIPFGHNGIFGRVFRLNVREIDHQSDQLSMSHTKHVNSSH